ncbi:hypothetical protein [Wenyingzhuangia sp. IMCC45574]
MKNLKKWMFILTSLALVIACSSSDDSDDMGGGSTADGITNVDFTTEISGDGTVVTVTPTATGATSYEVDFGTDATDDVKPTAGVPVNYDYPNETKTYTIKVTAMATGKEDVSTEKQVSITFTVPQTDAVGRWVLLHDAAALAIGPDATNFSWWSNGLADLKKRDCLFDDVYEFKSDGSFVNTLGSQTWGEPWMGTDPEACATPVAPFDGTASATWFHDETNNTITITGKGAYLGLAKIMNGKEIGNPSEAPDSVTYSDVTFSDDKNTMTVYITVLNDAGTDGKNGFWRFMFAKEGTPGASLPTTDSDNDGVADVDDACPDVHGGGNTDGCPSTGIGTDPHDDFEGAGNITWVGDAAGVEVVDNGWKTGINTSNKILKYEDTGGQYANIRFDLNEDKTDKFDLSTKNIFKVKVYVPSPATAHTQPKQLALKLQDGSSSSPWEGQVEVIQTYEYDTWQELTFDFSAQSAETKFSRIVVQFNSENNFEAVTGYIDDFTYGSN